jgi:competence protein ComEC
LNCCSTLKKYKKIFILLFLLILTLPAAASWMGRPATPLEKGKLYLFTFDVGQGDSSLFVLPDGETILIDAGPEDAGKKLVKELKKLGIRKIDLLVATHPHSDHIGGMKQVLSNFPVSNVWDSGFIHGSPPQNIFYRMIKDKNISFGRPKKGFHEKMGDTVIEVLAPSRLIRGTESDPNNNCLVLKIAYGNTSFLMLADMEREQYSTIKPLPRATVLKAAHHGSVNGTSMDLLNEVRPSIIILSYGKNNPYGYPHKKVVGAISALGITRLDTKDGTIEIISDGKKISYPRNREVTKNVN